MTFDAALDWLYSASMSGIKLGLENVRRLLGALGNPQEGATFLHVAGTNGKGSVCAILDAILRADGRRTGLYTSPHLIDFCERIRVDGGMVPRAEVAAGLTAIRDAAHGWEHPPTFFEVATVLALWHFARVGCDVVVLETGMGGRLDATNVVRPAVSVITPIAFDHMQWLGDTLAAIAAEKAGIIKPGVPVVSAPQCDEAADVIAARARELGAPLRCVTKPLARTIPGLAGSHQRINAAVAVAALDSLSVKGASIERGLDAVRWPGRFQRVGDRHVLDGGHNVHAVRQLEATCRETFGDERLTIIFGALTDKDYPAMIQLLAPRAREMFFVPVRSARSVAPDELAAAAAGPTRVFPDLAGALAAAPSGRVLITGSLFLVGEALELLGARPDPLVPPASGGAVVANLPAERDR